MCSPGNSSDEDTKPIEFGGAIFLYSEQLLRCMTGNCPSGGVAHGAISTYIAVSARHDCSSSRMCCRARSTGRSVVSLMCDDWSSYQSSRWTSSRTGEARSEEHTSELQSPYVISYAVFCL